MQMFFGNTCVICNAEEFIFQKKKNILGMTSPDKFSCKKCGSTFEENELKWKLTQMNSKADPIWQQFRQRSFYVREWINVINDTKWVVSIE